MALERWLIYAILAAVMASLVGILGKVGMKNVDSTLATVIRSVIMTVFLIAVATTSSVWSKSNTLETRSLLAILLSGIAGALSWLFYFKAIQLGEVSKVAPIDKLSMPLTVLLAVVLLHERPGGWGWLGITLIVIGVGLTLIPAGKP